MVLKLYCDKCDKFLIVDEDNCIVCINRQLDKVEKKIEKIKKVIEVNKILLNMGEHICRDIIYDILQIIEEE